MSDEVASDEWRVASGEFVTMAADCFLGLDLGQRVDHTALALVAPVVEADGPADYARFLQPTVERLRVRHLERLPLGTRYCEVVRRVRALTSGPEMRCCEVVADATGVGLPVVEMLQEAGLKAAVVPVTITSGGSARRDGGMWHVPRRDLLGRLVVEFEQGRLRLPARSALAGRLREEIAGVQAGSGRGSGHDDLVFALALAVWRVGRNGGPWERGRLF
jgi:hypothetical protein